MPNNFELQI